MAGTDTPGWSLGLRRIEIRPPPASFVPFFPVADQHATSTAESTSTAIQDASWADFFGAQGTNLRPPAWTRVAIEAATSTKASRTIMKKIGLPTRHVARNRPVEFATSQSAETQGQRAEVAQDDECEMPSSKHRRLSTFDASPEDHEILGRPQSDAEMIIILQCAKGDLANRLLAASADTLTKELEQLRKGSKNQVIPAKRRIDRKSRIEQDGMVGGFQLRSFELIWPVLRKAALSEDERNNTSATIISEISTYLRGMQQGQSSQDALRSLPKLFDVADSAEPESTMDLMRPLATAVETSSPTKRQAQPARPVGHRASRLSDTMVKLPPTSSHPAEPSPTKLSSAPSSPLAYTHSHRNIVTTSPSLRSTASNSSVRVVPAQQTSSARVNNGPEVFKVSACDDSSPSLQTLLSASLQPSLVQLSPMKRPQPFAHTPSRGNRIESSDRQSQTPCRRGSDLGLVDAIPVSTPQLPASTIKGVDLKDSTPFSFGPISPSCNSPSWLRNSVSTRSSRGGSKGLGKGSRRKSEPLIRSCFRSHADARRSFSSKELTFSSSLLLNEDHLELTTLPSLDSSNESVASAANVSQQRGLDTPVMQQSAGATRGGTVTPAISWAKMTGRAPPTAVLKSTPLTHAGSGPDNVFNVDMRQNLDIFGGSQATSPKSAKARHLTQTVGERCASRTTVAVAREHGRLFVRFKMPVEVAFNFPKSQGFDKSRFMATPSAVFSSPSITWKSRDRLVDAIVAPSSSSHEQALPATPATPDETVVVPTLVHPLHACSLAAGEAACPGVDSTPRTIVGSEGHITVEENSLATLWPSKPEQDTFDNRSSRFRGTPPRAHGQADSWMTDLSRASAINHFAIAGPASNETEESAVPQQVSTPTPDAIDAIPTDSPNAVTTFTPVNINPPNGTTQAAPASDASQQVQLAPGSACGPVQQHSYDSPGRAYMRDFIKRSKPKRLSATETGSPMKRKPLGVKSPNTESPQKGKYKSGSEKLDAHSPPENRDEPAPKRLCRSRRTTSRAETDHLDKPETTQQSSMLTEPAATRVAENPGGDEDYEEAGDVPATRRSSRLRSQDKVEPTPKSSIPTAIKFGCRSGAGRGPCRSIPRTEKQDLTYQTRVNTRKNRGNAEYPAQFLARQSSDESEMDGVGSQVAGAAESLQRRKCVGWKDPLEAHQDDKPKRGRPAKTQATQCNTNTAKPARTSAFAQRQRTAKAAASLGMSANGTPAKAGRVTRSSSRFQQ